MLSARTLIATMAASAFRAIEALPTMMDTDPSCSIMNSRPGEYLCGVQGQTETDWGKLGDSRQVPTASSCADSCSSIQGCTFFTYETGNKCQLWSSNIHNALYRGENTGIFFYELDCFQCRNANTVLALDFADNDINPWSMEWPDGTEFALDILSTRDYGNVLRVLEGSNTGTARIHYANSFPLEPFATYRFSFLAMSNNPDVQPFGNLQFEISRGDQTVFKSFPEHGKQYFARLVQFASQFTIADGMGGSAFLNILVEASGSQIDWYFGAIFIQKLQSPHLLSQNAVEDSQSRTAESGLEVQDL